MIQGKDVLPPLTDVGLKLDRVEDILTDEQKADLQKTLEYMAKQRRRAMDSARNVSLP